jgi:hypothetical protein
MIEIGVTVALSLGFAIAMWRHDYGVATLCGFGLVILAFLV